MLNTPTVTSPLPNLMTTLRAADPRLVRLVHALTFAFLFMTVAALPLGCSVAGHLVNEGLDQATLLMFGLLPVLYVSGRRRLG